MSEEKKAEAKKVEATEEAPQKTQQKVPKPHVTHQAHPHGKKIGRMNLAELEMALERCQKQMGGWWSRYGLSLAGRKAALTHASIQLKKAA